MQLNIRKADTPYLAAGSKSLQRFYPVDLERDESKSLQRFYPVDLESDESKSLQRFYPVNLKRILYVCFASYNILRIK